MEIGIIDLCKQIEDPSMNRKKVHKMETSIYIFIAAVICEVCLLYTSRPFLMASMSVTASSPLTWHNRQDFLKKTLNYFGKL